MGAAQWRPRPWWRSLPEDDVCPITLECVRELSHAPFELGGHHFEPVALAQYLAQYGALHNPITRAAVTEEECKRLDEHLRNNNLPAHNVQQAHADAEAERERQQAQGSEPRSSPEDQASQVLTALFAPSSHRSSSPQARRRRRRLAGASATTPQEAEDGPRVIDDDRGMTLGPASVETDGQRGEARREEEFPALSVNRSIGGREIGTTTRRAIPEVARRSQLGRRTTRGGDNARREQERRSGGSDRRVSAGRLRQLADAFGIEDPERRPSSFAKSSHETFPQEVIDAARNDLPAVRELEEQMEELALEGASRSRPRRQELPPASRQWRHLQHSLAEAYGMASCAYGEGPNRAVHVFAHSGAGVPPQRLSDAALMGESEGESERNEGTRPVCVKVRLEGERGESDVMGNLWEWSSSGEAWISRWLDERRLEVAFASERARDDALRKLGGGVRGAFVFEGGERGESFSTFSRRRDNEEGDGGGRGKRPPSFVRRGAEQDEQASGGSLPNPFAALPSFDSDDESS